MTDSATTTAGMETTGRLGKNNSWDGENWQTQQQQQLGWRQLADSVTTTAGTEATGRLGNNNSWDGDNWQSRQQQLRWRQLTGKKLNPANNCQSGPRRTELPSLIRRTAKK